MPSASCTFSVAKDTTDAIAALKNAAPIELDTARTALIIVTCSYFTEVYMDGRSLPVNPNPTWNGYSTGHWEGDTLVIETNGIRDDMWLDIQGSPVTESARVTERLKRLNFCIMQVEISVNDPKAYTKPWSVTIEMAVQVDTQMLEEICMDNERDTRLYKK